MARIAVEQLVDGMQIDEQWVQSNLSDAALEVQRLATMLVDEKSSSSNELDIQMLQFLGGIGGQDDARRIPGSGFQKEM